MYWITPNSTEFCSKMGYPVTSSNKCWDGVPLAQRVSIDRRGAGITQHAYVELSVTQILYALARRFKPLKVASVIAGIVLFLGAGYLINKWQRRLIMEDDAMMRARK